MKYANTWLTPYNVGKIYLFLEGKTNPTEQEIYNIIYSYEGKQDLTKIVISQAIDVMYLRTFGCVVSDENFKTTLMMFIVYILGPILLQNIDTLFNVDTLAETYDDYIEGMIRGSIPPTDILTVLKWAANTIALDIINNHLTFLKALIENVNYYNYITMQGVGHHELTSEYEGKPMEKAVNSLIEPINDNINQFQDTTIIAKGTSGQSINEMLYNGPAWYKAMGSYASEMNMDWLKESINKLFVEVY